MIEFPNQVPNQLREIQKLAEKFNGEELKNLELRVKKLEGELMAMKARLGKHG
jgi:hypothetical protein